jgi:hypothetical protein
MLLSALGVAQIQSTISCPSGHSYWDTLSVMMLDPSLAAGYHMEGYNAQGNPDAYVYTTWVSGQNKVYYVKNPQGNPWDINLYDYQPGIPSQGYVYQWVTELDGHWNDATSCKKFNNSLGEPTSDLSMRWASRCAVPGGENSAFWNPKPVDPNPPQYSTRYYRYINQAIQPAQDLGNAYLELKPTGTISITDTRNNTPPNGTTFSVTTLPLQYTYSCSQQNIDYCASREVFEYALDTNVNPVDGKKHSYGWIRWRLYKNVTNPIGSGPANWQLQQTTLHDHLVAGTAPINFQCF